MSEVTLIRSVSLMGSPATERVRGWEGNDPKT